VGAIPVLPGFVNAATTEGWIVSDPNFFDQLYRYGVFVGFGLAAVTYVVLMRAEIPARSPASAPAEP
jgi:NCS1 family nucleobase:cation symporter-1